MNWKKIEKHFRPGREFASGKYRVLGVDKKGIAWERVATGSPFRVSRSMLERTEKRLRAGEEISRRAISYTSAIEFGVVAALRVASTLTETKTGYRK